MEKKKVLILGGSHRDIPLINALKDMGYYVITFGKREYYIGHRFADSFYEEDFSDINLVESVALKERVIHIIPGCSELAYINSVILTNKLKLNIFDHLDNLDPLFDKWKLKELCWYLGIPTPAGYRIDMRLKKIKRNLPYPLIVKPVDQSGARSVSVVRNEKEMKKALDKIITGKDYAMAEDYIEGRIVAYSCVLSEGKIIFDFIAEDVTLEDSFYISTSYPLWDEKLKLKLRGHIGKLINHLGLEWGAIHAQFIEKGSVHYLIDITRRIPGDLFPFLIELSTKFPYSSAVAMSYIGKPLRFKGDLSKKNVIRHCVFAGKQGKFLGIKMPPKLENNLILKIDTFSRDQIINDNLANVAASILFFEFRNINHNLITQIKKGVVATVSRPSEKLY